MSPVITRERSGLAAVGLAINAAGTVAAKIEMAVTKKKPVINYLDPATHEAGESFLLAVIGKNFDGDAKILLGLEDDVNGASEKTTDPKSSTRLEWQTGRFTEGTYYVWVRESSGTSASAALMITKKYVPPPPPPKPYLNYITPKRVEAHKPFTLDVYGAHFIDGSSEISMDGSVRDTKYHSDSHLSTHQTDLYPGKWTVKVKTRSQYSDDSATLDVYKKPATNVFIDSVDPKEGEAGYPFTLTVNGRGFGRSPRIGIQGLDGAWYYPRTVLEEDTRVAARPEGYGKGTHKLRAENMDSKEVSDAIDYTFAGVTPNILHLEPNPVILSDMNFAVELNGENIKEGGKLLADIGGGAQDLIALKLATITDPEYPRNLMIHLDSGLVAIMASASPPKPLPIQWQNPNGEKSDVYELKMQK